MGFTFPQRMFMAAGLTFWVIISIAECAQQLSLTQNLGVLTVAIAATAYQACVHMAQRRRKARINNSTN